MTVVTVVLRNGPNGIWFGDEWRRPALKIRGVDSLLQSLCLVQVGFQPGERRQGIHCELGGLIRGLHSLLHIRIFGTYVITERTRVDFAGRAKCIVAAMTSSNIDNRTLGSALDKTLTSYYIATTVWRIPRLLLLLLLLLPGDQVRSTCVASLTLLENPEEEERKKNT